MKIIHCADLHLDAKMSAHLSKEKARERRNELLSTFLRLVQYAKENRVDAILIVGDLFDTKLVSVTTRNSVQGAILSNPEIAFYYLKGNHDADSFLDNLEEIPSNLYLFTDKWTSYLPGDRELYTKEENKAHPVRITGIEQNSGNKDTLYDELILNNDEMNIVLMHGQESAYRGKDKAEMIHLGALRNKGIDYLALGHVHSYKQEQLDSRGVYCYCGCLEGRGFDECGVCGFVLLNADEATGSLSREFIPFAQRTLYTVTVDVSGCISSHEMRDCIENRLSEEKYPETALLKIVLQGEVDVLCEKDIGALTKQFDYRYYFLKIEDETRLAVDYESYALDESLKGEFIRTVRSKDIDEETKAEIIRVGIMALSGETV